MTRARTGRRHRQVPRADEPTPGGTGGFPRRKESACRSPRSGPRGGHRTEGPSARTGRHRRPAHHLALGHWSDPQAPEPCGSLAWVPRPRRPRALGLPRRAGVLGRHPPWMLYLAAGWMFLVAASCTPEYSRRTAARHPMQTNGFQYELGFVSFGGGLAGIYAFLHGAQAWVAVSISITVFLVAAGVDHVIQIVRDHTLHPATRSFASQRLRAAHCPLGALLRPRRLTTSPGTPADVHIRNRLADGSPATQSRRTSRWHAPTPPARPSQGWLGFSARTSRPLASGAVSGRLRGDLRSHRVAGGPRLPSRRPGDRRRRVRGPRRRRLRRHLCSAAPCLAAADRIEGRHDRPGRARPRPGSAGPPSSSGPCCPPWWARPPGPQGPRPGRPIVGVVGGRPGRRHLHGRPRARLRGARSPSGSHRPRRSSASRSAPWPTANSASGFPLESASPWAPSRSASSGCSSHGRTAGHRRTGVRPRRLTVVGIGMYVSAAGMYMRTILYRFATDQPIPDLGVDVSRPSAPSAGTGGRGPGWTHASTHGARRTGDRPADDPPVEPGGPPVAGRPAGRAHTSPGGENPRGPTHLGAPGARGRPGADPPRSWSPPPCGRPDHTYGLRRRAHLAGMSIGAPGRDRAPDRPGTPRTTRSWPSPWTAFASASTAPVTPGITAPNIRSTSAKNAQNPLRAPRSPVDRGE